jgi:hypothetical protein
MGASKRELSRGRHYTELSNSICARAGKGPTWVLSMGQPLHGSCPMGTSKQELSRGRHYTELSNSLCSRAGMGQPLHGSSPWGILYTGAVQWEHLNGSCPGAATTQSCPTASARELDRGSLYMGVHAYIQRG